MNRIEEIKERMNNLIKTLNPPVPVDFRRKSLEEFDKNAPGDVAYLLALIEIAEKSLESAQKEMARAEQIVEDQMGEGRDFETMVAKGDVTDAYKEVTAALNQLRGG